MNQQGLLRCAKYAYPPNSLSLCGPDKKNELSWYKKSGVIDPGTSEILSMFKTMYPYLKLISISNNIADPFDPRVVDAYWLGNPLLSEVKLNDYINHLKNNLSLDKKITKKSFRLLTDQLSNGILPNHAYHVLAIWLRTGNIDEEHSIHTMNACIINQGIIKEILPDELIVQTKSLTNINNKISFGSNKTIEISVNDVSEIKELKAGDFISFHWGMFVEKLDINKQKRLTYYTNMAMRLVNNPKNFYADKTYLYHR